MTTEGALAGLKVLDVAGTIASGYCGKLFADHGAEVIDVEPADGGFETRRQPPFIPGADAPESCALHGYLSTNKASVALDVGAEPEQLVRLAQGGAVVLDDGRFDCAAFTEVAPEVVVSTITWFGRHGPYADFKGNGAVCWSLGGMVRNVGPEQGPPWVPTGCGAEIVGGLAAYIGTLGQVIARRTGNATGPVRLDTSIHEANLCFTEVGGVGGYRSGRRGKRLGVNRFAPTYPGIDGFGDVADRLSRNDELDAAVANFTQGHVAEVLMLELQAVGVRAGYVASGLELATDPHLAGRGFWKLMERVHVGVLPHPAAPYRVGNEPFDIDRPAPTLGQHNREVLSDLLGLSEAEIDDLEREGIIGTEPRLQ